MKKGVLAENGTVLGQISRKPRQGSEIGKFLSGRRVRRKLSRVDVDPDKSCVENGRKL